MYNYKCIIFDCDGVLVDTEPIGNQVLVDMANQLGANIDLNYAYHHFKGNALKSCMLQIEALIHKKLPEDFEQKFRELSFERFKTDVKPIKGIETVIKNLSIPFCVASSGPVNKIRLNLALTGLLHYFEDKIFSCYDINTWKPDPEVFLWAARTMGVLPKDCLVIEDSELGVKAAINGGFNVLGYAKHDLHNHLEKLGIPTFHNMLNLTSFLIKN